MPKLPEKYGASQTFKIMIAGYAKHVEECKSCIMDIMEYGHHVITHPGRMHAEVAVDQSL